MSKLFVSKLTPTVSGIVTVLRIDTKPVGAIGGYDGRECGASVDVEATDPPRGKAAHDALCDSVSTQSVGRCIPTRSVRNDERSIREQAHTQVLGLSRD